jgi:hypothetical protein
MTMTIKFLEISTLCTSLSGERGHAQVGVVA